MNSININTYHRLKIQTQAHYNTCHCCHHVYEGRKSVCSVCCTEIQYMPLHTKYMSLHINTYILRYIPDTYQHEICAAHEFCPAYTYWHVSCYVLVCIVQVLRLRRSCWIEKSAQVLLVRCWIEIQGKHCWKCVMTRKQFSPKNTEWGFVGVSA